MKDKLDFSWQEKKKIARLVCNGRISYYKEKKSLNFFGECDYYQLFIASQKGFQNTKFMFRNKYCVLL